MCCIRLPPYTIQEEEREGQNDGVNKRNNDKGKGRRNSFVDFIPPIFRKEKNNAYHQQIMTMNEIVEECTTNV